MKKRLNSRGDTIVEILLSISVLSMVLVIAYGLANRSQQTNMAARERSEAQKLSEKQLELLRGYVSPSQGIDWGSNICFREADNLPTATVAECTTGIDNRYSMAITVVGTAADSFTYTVTTSWDNIKGNTNELKLSIKLPATDEVIAFSPPAAPVAPPPSPSVSWSANGSDFTLCERSPDPVMCQIQGTSVYSLAGGNGWPNFKTTYAPQFGGSGLPSGDYNITLEYRNFSLGGLPPPPFYKFNIDIYINGTRVRDNQQLTAANSGTSIYFTNIFGLGGPINSIMFEWDNDSNPPGSDANFQILTVKMTKL
jgi:Tfp pilus assembly protein PilV